MQYELRTHTQVREVGEAALSSLSDEATSPFMKEEP